MKLDAALQEIDGTGAAENMVVKAFRVGAGEDERNAAPMIGKLPHPFEGVLAVGRV